MDDEGIPVGVAARHLKISTQRVRQLVAEGRLSARRGPYGMRLIPKSEVLRLAEQREQQRGRARR